MVGELVMEKLILSAFADEAGASLAEQIKALNENDIPYIELRGVNGKNISDHTPKEAEAIAKELKHHGISVWSIGSPIGKVRLSSPFEAELARFENTLAVARAAEARCIRLFSFFEASDKDAEEVIERLAAFAEAAKDSGITLCHENEKGIFGDSAPLCQKLLQKVPSLQAVFDPANFIQCGQDTEEAWELLADRVYYLHIKDALPDGTVVPAGRGIGELRSILKDFLARGGRVASLEPHLHSFTGLSALSEEDAKRILGSGAFTTAREAFDYAVKSLRELAEGL